VSRGARLTFCEEVLSVSESLVFPLPLQQSAFGNIVSFYKSSFYKSPTVTLL